MRYGTGQKPGRNRTGTGTDRNWNKKGDIRHVQERDTECGSGTGEGDDEI